MKILHLSTERRGGAGMAAMRLHNGLLAEGVESILFTRENLNNIPYKGVNGLFRRMRDSITYRNSLKKNLTPEILNSLIVCSDIRTFVRKEYFLQFPDADIINLHWVSDFFDYKDFFRYFAKTPIVWTLHDKNAIMGACHYQHDTDQLAELIAHGMPLNSKKRYDIDHKIWQLKKRIYDSIPASKLTIVTPSQWLKTEAIHSGQFAKFKKICIPNGINTQVFYPKDKASARKKFNIPEHAQVVLFCANWMDNKYKGFHVLEDALNKTNGKYYLVALGNRKTQDQMEGIHYLGGFSDENILALIYSAADVFVIPTLEDNFPNTILESMSCGTPIIGSNVGGVPETVREGITGFLFESNNSCDLANKIDNFFSDKQLAATMSATCRNTAVAEYALPLQAQKYIDLYKGLLGCRK